MKIWALERDSYTSAETDKLMNSPATRNIQPLFRERTSHFQKKIKYNIGLSANDLESFQEFCLPDSAEFIEAQDVRQVLIAQGFQYSTKASVLSLMMTKGGVGKTIVTQFLGLRLASYGARVLMIDSDPQANLSLSLGYPADQGDESVDVLADVVAGRCSLKKSIVALHPYLHILASCSRNSMLERLLMNRGRASLNLIDSFLDDVRMHYDFILVDCAPSLNVSNAAIMIASDFIILPFRPNLFGKFALQQTISEFEDLKNQFGARANLKVLLNDYKVDSQTRPYLNSIIRKERRLFLNSTINSSVDIQSSINERIDFYQSPSSQARLDFDQLARETLKNLKSVDV